MSGFKQKSEASSIALEVTNKKSADLSLGRRPTSKSEEFSFVTPRVIELQRCENIDFGVKWFSYWEFDPILD